jgi:drug/metabolite transporter superfamily protein YnfA
MMVTLRFRTERAVVFAAFIIFIVTGMLLTLPMPELAGRVWVGGLLCGMGLGFWGWFLSMDEPKKLP